MFAVGIVKNKDICKPRVIDEMFREICITGDEVEAQMIVNVLSNNLSSKNTIDKITWG